MREDAAKPRFYLSHRGYSGGSRIQVQIVLRNDGGTALKTVVELDQPAGKATVLNRVPIKADAEQSIDVTLDANSVSAGNIRWIDVLGNRGMALFRLQMLGTTLNITQPISPENGE